MWSIVAVQGCKMLNLMALPSKLILFCIFHLLSYTLPFAIHGEIVTSPSREVKDNQDDDSADVDAVVAADLSSHAHAPPAATREGLQFTSKLLPANVFLGIYLFMAFSSTVKINEYLMRDILAAMLMRDPTDEQKVAASLALYFVFTGLLFLAFWRAAATLRRYAPFFSPLLFLSSYLCFNLYFLSFSLSLSLSLAYSLVFCFHYFLSLFLTFFYFPSFPSIFLSLFLSFFLYFLLRLSLSSSRFLSFFLPFILSFYFLCFFVINTFLLSFLLSFYHFLSPYLGFNLCPFVSNTLFLSFFPVPFFLQFTFL